MLASNGMINAGHQDRVLDFKAKVIGGNKKIAAINFSIS